VSLVLGEQEAQMEYENKSDRWQFENEFCVDKSDIWLHEALNLKYSAQVLNDYTWNLSDELLNKKNYGQKYPAFWTARIERMLWGYSFENLFKAKIISDLKIDEGIRQVPFPEIKSHDLLLLANKAKIVLSEEERFYLKILGKCAVWAGRYPIPAKESQLPQTRKAMNTKEELLARSKKQHELLLKGKIKRTITENDILHSGLGTLELKLYQDLFDRVQGSLE
jgi:hypothetical protein